MNNNKIFLISILCVMAFGACSQGAIRFTNDKHYTTPPLPVISYKERVRPIKNAKELGEDTPYSKPAQQDAVDKDLITEVQPAVDWWKSRVPANKKDAVEIAVVNEKVVKDLPEESISTKNTSSQRNMEINTTLDAMVKNAEMEADILRQKIEARITESAKAGEIAIQKITNATKAKVEAIKRKIAFDAQTEAKAKLEAAKIKAAIAKAKMNAKLEKIRITEAENAIAKEVESAKMQMELDEEKRKSDERIKLMEEMAKLTSLKKKNVESEVTRILSSELEKVKEEARLALENVKNTESEYQEWLK